MLRTSLSTYLTETLETETALHYQFSLKVEIKVMAPGQVLLNKKGQKSSACDQQKLRMLKSRHTVHISMAQYDVEFSLEHILHLWFQNCEENYVSAIHIMSV